MVAEYTYNGLNMRIGWHSDADADADVDGSDPWYSFAMDDRWRIVATFRGSDTSPKELFAYHAAGVNGTGSSLYIDSPILRNKDANTAWTTASDGTLEERVYYVQNWRADVSAVLSDAGLVKEWVKYTSYGIPFRIDPGDYNRDGYVNGNDYDDFADDFDNAETSADVNFDGYVNGTDFDEYSEAWDYSGFVAGRGHLSAFNNTIGYAGYTWDPACSRYHVRHRVYAPELGRWLTRDPLGYVDSDNLYEYVGSYPLDFTDPSGLGRDSVDRDWNPKPPTPTVPRDGRPNRAPYDIYPGDSPQDLVDRQLPYLKKPPAPSVPGTNTVDEFLEGYADGTYCWCEGFVNTLLAPVPGIGEVDFYTPSPDTPYLGVSNAMGGVSCVCLEAAAGCKFGNFNGRPAIHAPHAGGPHQFWHFQFNWWRPGVRGSGGVFRIRLWF